MISLKHLFAVLLIFSFCSCEGPQQPYLVGMRNYKVQELSIEMIRIQADGIYHNPNSVGVNIENWDIKVTANGINIAEVDIQIPTNIPPKGDFSIPITTSFPPSKILELDNGILTGLLTAFKSREVEMKYFGSFTMNVLGKHMKVPIDAAEVIQLKK